MFFRWGSKTTTSTTRREDGRRSGVFVSYRRADRKLLAESLANKLKLALGPRNVFFDATGGSEVGDSFPDSLVEGLRRALVLVVGELLSGRMTIAVDFAG